MEEKMQTVTTVMDNAFTESPKEICFPSLPSTTECRRVKAEIAPILKRHKHIMWITSGSFVLFLILAEVLFFTGLSAGNSNYIGAIIFGIFCVLSIVLGIINLVHANKYSKLDMYLNSALQINEQYAAFIEQGYEEKEAYKLTLEWIDRKEMKQAISQAGTAVASSVLLSQFLNK